MDAVGSSKKQSLVSQSRSRRKKRDAFAHLTIFLQIAPSVAYQTVIVDRFPGYSSDLDKFFERKQSTLLPLVSERLHSLEGGRILYSLT